MTAFFKKMAIPGLFFVHFRLFKQLLQFLQQISVKKYSMMDSNQRTSGHESPPITIDQGLNMTALAAGTVLKLSIVF